MTFHRQNDESSIIRPSLGVVRYCRIRVHGFRRQRCCLLRHQEGRQRCLRCQGRGAAVAARRAASVDGYGADARRPPASPDRARSGPETKRSKLERSG